ncbi:hypothetical protein [Streptomyces sp. NPDC018833]|uniref:hypothetical protein n=1 Tax=Streptomyces sp. NPDC018833 TaxID=3365053 RepID=UPI0037AEA97A
MSSATGLSIIPGAGFDVRERPGFTVLRSTCELLMVTWLAQNAGENRAPPKKSRSVLRRCGQVAPGGLGRRSNGP